MKKRALSRNTLLWLAAVVFVLAVIWPSAVRTAHADSGQIYTVSVSEGYLALRNAKAYAYENEIGKLYTGQTVQVVDTSDSTYWYVYAPSLGKNGYVNRNYLLSTIGSAWTVRVDSGYLALRTEKAFDYANEIGELYTGDTVHVQDATDSQYWYVYSPKHNRSGYVNKDYLYGGTIGGTGRTGTVKVASGYLALRTAKAYDYANEIGKMYTGETVQILSTSDSQYWYVYSPKLGLSGYANKDYIITATTGGESRTVKVASGYLALRTAKAYDYANEIGELYTGDTVQLIDTSDSQYWYVYAPKLGKSGYVNKDYLTGGSAIETRTVKVASGYLALRTAKEFDYDNEIGELYTGEKVQVVSKDAGQYWYVYSTKHAKYGYVNKDYLY